eukprot:403341682
MEDTLAHVLNELTLTLQKNQQERPSLGSLPYGQTLLHQILGEASEFVKILDKVLKQMKINGHPYLRKGLPKQKMESKVVSSLNTRNAATNSNSSGLTLGLRQLNDGKKSQNIPQPEPQVLQEDLPSGFKNRQTLEQFLQFFNAYLKRIPRIIEISLKIANSEAILYSDTSSLKFFRMKYKNFISQTIQRCYKVVVVLLKLFPDSREAQEESIFDKIYLIQLLLQTLNSSKYSQYLKQSKSHEFEEVAKNVLSTGGTKTKSVKEISETSKIIKEKMDQELLLILNFFEIKAEFFVSSPSLKKIWSSHFQDSYKGNTKDQLLTQERLENMKWYFSIHRDETSVDDKQNFMLSLDHIVNITDFINFSTLLRMFEPDIFDHCLEKIRSETSLGHIHIKDETLSRLSESVNAKYLSRDIAKTYLRTLFVRSLTDIKKNPHDLLIILSLFGVKNIYLYYKDKLLHEILQEDLQNNINLAPIVEEKEIKIDSIDDKYQNQVQDGLDKNRILSCQGYLQMNLEAFQEGSLNKKFNDMASISYFSTTFMQNDNVQDQLMDELKRSKNFQNYDKRDYGYLATFEHENEANELLSKKGFQTLFSEILNEKDAKMPVFIKFDTLNDYYLVSIKHQIMKSYQITYFELWETQKQISRTQEKYLIRKKYFDLYLMVGNISIDGFKRERYILKVKDFQDDIARAQNMLNEEEMNVEIAAQQNGGLVYESLQIDGFKDEQELINSSSKKNKKDGLHNSTKEKENNYQLLKAKTTISYAENLQNITELLLKIETLEESRKKLQEKLTLKEKKWIENDKLFKERRFTLMGVLQQDLALLCDVTKHLYYIETISHKRITQHEKVVLMIDQLFSANRLKSQRFLGEIQMIVKDKQDQLYDLKRTYNDLIAKDQLIESGNVKHSIKLIDVYVFLLIDQQQMKKQIEEMIQLGNLRRERDQVMIDIQEQELRITQLKKYLGITDKNKSQTRKLGPASSSGQSQIMQGMPLSQSTLSQQSKQSINTPQNIKTTHRTNESKQQAGLPQIKEVMEINFDNEDSEKQGWDKVRQSTNILKAVANLNRISPEKKKENQ